MSDTLTNMLIIIVCINVVLWLGQVAVLKNNPEAVNFISCSGSILESGSAGGCDSYTIDDSNPTERLPSGASAVQPETGLTYTDIPTSIKNFFLNTLGLGYVVQILSAPYNFLKALSLPQEFVFTVGSLWYIISIFILAAWILGRD